MGQEVGDKCRQEVVQREEKEMALTQKWADTNPNVEYPTQFQ